MADLEQYASAHESFVELLRSWPRPLLASWLGALTGLDIERIAAVHERTPTIEIPARVRRARRAIVDLVLTVHTKGGRTIRLWILEVQLSWDEGKLWDWPRVTTAFAAESRVETKLLVFMPDPRLRARLRRRGLSNIEPRPTLIEPDQIELICDYDEARRRPHQAIFGAVYHAREDSPIEQRVAGVRAAFVGMRTLSLRDFRRYAVLVLKLTPPEVSKRALAQLRQHDELEDVESEFIEDIERDGYLYQRVQELAREHGRQKGREEGRLEGREEGRLEGEVRVLRRVLVDLLELRGFDLAASVRERIEHCEDLELLERWYTEVRSLPSDASPEQLLV